MNSFSFSKQLMLAKKEFERDIQSDNDFIEFNNSFGFVPLATRSDMLINRIGITSKQLIKAYLGSSFIK